MSVYKAAATGGLLGLALLLGACQGLPVSEPLGAVQAAPKAKAVDAERLRFAAPDVWGGQVRCDAQRVCRLALVEHERSYAVAHQFEGRKLREIGRAKVAYHPDSARWLTDRLLVAAVEVSSSLDVFALGKERLEPVAEVSVGFAPRDVVVLNSQAGRHRMLATPYSGDQVAWVDWDEATPAKAQVVKTRLCQGPWHPTSVARAPSAAQAGIAVGCLNDKRVMWAPLAAPSQPRQLARFDAVPRQVRVSPSGKWLYVALETGGRNARIDMDSGEVQYIAAPPTGAVGVAVPADDSVMWSDSDRIYWQRLDAQGQVLQTRWLRTSGFSTNLQLVDVDGDGEQDLLVFNSTGKQSEVIFGPLWASASAERP